MRGQRLPLNDLVLHHRTVQHDNLLGDPDVHGNEAERDEGQGGHTVSSGAVQRKRHQVTRGIVIVLVFEGKSVRLVPPAGSSDPVEELKRLRADGAREPPGEDPAQTGGGTAA